MMDTGTSQILLPAKFHNFTVSGLFFIHKNERVQFFMKHGVESVFCQSYSTQAILKLSSGNIFFISTTQLPKCTGLSKIDG